MQKKFFQNLMLVLVLNVLVKPFYILGIDAEILKQVESSYPGDYGEYFSLMSLTFILNIFLDLGINNYNTRNLARYSHLFSKYFAGILSIRILLALGYILFVLLAGIFLGYSENQFALLSFLVLNQILISFIQFFRSNLAGLLLFKQDSFISVLDRVLLIGICSVMLWGGITNEPIRIEWFIIAQTAAYFLTFVIAAFLVIRRAGAFKASFKLAFSWMIIKKSLPYALLILLMMIYYRSDSVMLERISANGARDAATYARGYRFFEALNMVGYLFAGLLLPIFAHQIKRRENPSVLLNFALKLIISYCLLFGVICYAFQMEIMEWRFDISQKELYESGISFGALMLCFIFFCITYIYSTLLTANGSMKKLNITAGTGVVINIALNIYLIPKEGAYGAAIASLITQIFTTIAMIYIAHKTMQIRIETSTILRLLAFTVLIILIALSKDYIAIGWKYQFGLAILLGGIGSVLIGLVSLKEIKLIIRNDS